MDLKEAQAILREHGLEDFPRPWIFETADALLKQPDLQIKYSAFGDLVGFAKCEKCRPYFGDLMSPMRLAARETALLMGWKPKGEEDA